MSKKQILVTLTIILTIFMVGFVLRAESTNIPGIPSDEKAYYEDQYGLPYMYELDSYYNYRLTKNYLDHGYMGDIKVNDTEWDFHSYAPSGVPMDYPPLIVYLTAFIYKFVNLFTSVPILVVCFWLPAFIGPLAGIVAYFFVRRYTNNYGAAFAGILTVTVPLYFFRTVPGWFDTDMFNVFFPLLVTWLFVEAVTAKKLKNQILLSILAAFSIFIFSLAWNGWQYQFYMLVLFSVIYIFWRTLKRKSVKEFLYPISIFFAGTLILIISLTGFLNVINLFEGPLSLINIMSVHGSWVPWPDIYVSVSELKEPSLVEIVSGVGPTFFGGIFGLLLIFRVLVNKKLKKKILNRMTGFFYMILVLWTVIGFISIKEGARFIILLIPPLVISSGIMIGLTVEYISLLKESKRFHIFRKNKKLIKTISVTILLIVTVPAVLNVYTSTSILHPSLNDDLWDATVWINNNTSNDTVIVSDWGYGHFFSAIADRPVAIDGRLAYIETLPIRNFDGGYKFGSESPSPSREYWIDHAFATDNESLSLGIFEMITTNGDMGYITLNRYIKNTSESVDILNNILGVNRDSARTILVNKYHLNGEQADNIIQYTHPSNPRPFVILTSTGFLLGRGQCVFNFGEWNFNKLEGGHYTYSVGIFTIKNSTLNSTNDVIMNMKKGDVTWNGQNPYSVIVISNGTIKEQRVNSKSEFSIAVLKDRNKTIVIDKNLEDSMFMKLWVEDSNSTIFKPIYRKGAVTVWECV